MLELLKRFSTMSEGSNFSRKLECLKDYCGMSGMSTLYKEFDFSLRLCLRIVWSFLSFLDDNVRMGAKKVVRLDVLKSICVHTGIVMFETFKVSDPIQFMTVVHEALGQRGICCADDGKSDFILYETVYA
jgi:hypothetical protein